MFGSKSEKDIKGMMPLVEQTNAEFAKLTSISDDQLRARTGEIKDAIKSKLASIDGQIEELNKKN